MTGRLKLALAAAIAAALGAIAATIWVGASVREETVVARPYEDGLRHDAERHARAALGLSVRLLPLGDAPEAGAGPIDFELADRAGRPLEDAAVRIELSRPETSRGERSAEARSQGGGRFSADLGFPEAGPWDVRFDVAVGRGGDRVRLERRVVARAACDLGTGPCTRPLPGGGDVTLELSPRPLRTMRDLAVRAELRGPGAPTPGTTVAISFTMRDMDMGRNEVALTRAAAPGSGPHVGTAVLVRCPSGRGDWFADVRVSRPGEPPETARFRLTVAE